MKAPLTMPVSGMSLQQFELDRLDYDAPEASGRQGGVQAGPPLWMGAWTIGTIGAAKSDELRAFMAALRGSIRWFLGRDLTRPFPKTYASGFAGMTRAGGGSFDGTATSWSETVNSDEDQVVTINGLPAGFVLDVGDYVGFRWTATDAEVAGQTWHAPVRCIETKTANGSGVISNIMVEPPIPSVVPSTATLYLDTPVAVMKQVPAKSSLDAVDRRLAVRGGMLTGIQDLRA